MIFRLLRAVAQALRCFSSLRNETIGVILSSLYVLASLCWCAGIGYTTEDFTSALIIDPLIEKSFELYFTRYLTPRWQVGCHVHRLTEKQLTSAKVAGSYLYDKHTTFKGRFDDRGLVAGVLQYSPTPLVTFSMLAEVNSRDLKAQPNIGLSLSVLAA